MDYSLLLTFFKRRALDQENNSRGYTFHIKKDKDNNIDYEFEENK